MESKLEKLYEEVIHGTVITNELLWKIGFTALEVADLLKRGVIVFNEKIYEFKDADALCNYARKFEQARNYDRANEAYRKAFDINKSCKEAAYRFVFLSVKGKHSVRALDAIEQVRTFDEQDANILLFLFVMSGRANAKVKEQVQRIDPVSFMRFHEEEFSEMPEVKKKIAAIAFKPALKLLNDLFQKQDNLVDFRYRAYRLLLITCIEQQERNHLVISSYYNCGKLQELKTFLEFQPFLDRVTEALLYLLRDYLCMISTNEVIPVIPGESPYLSVAIKHHDFDRALEIREQNKQKYVHDSLVGECVADLLNKIIAFRNQLQKEGMHLARIQNKVQDEGVE